MVSPLILVLDDDPAFRDLMDTLLRDEGYQVCTWGSSDGVQGLVQQHRPALVITDVRLDGAQAGWAVVEALRADPATRPIPIIVCSADAVFLQERSEALSAAGVAVLTKPFDLDDLLTTVRVSLGGQPAGASSSPVQLR